MLAACVRDATDPDWLDCAPRVVARITGRVTPLHSHARARIAGAAIPLLERLRDIS